MQSIDPKILSSIYGRGKVASLPQETFWTLGAAILRRVAGPEER